jgi:hypothetical protein
VGGLFFLLAQSPDDARQYTFRVLEHLVVPKANDREAFCFEPTGAKFVGLGLLSMLPSVELDHQAAFEADEIDDKPAQERLAAEAMAIELLLP